MADEEYEILPHKLLSDLKFDVEALKKKLTQPDTKINELILEIESMKDSIHELNSIFERALEGTKDEDISQIVKSLNERLEAVIAQNETIARGMIAISDKLEDFMAKQRVSKPPIAAPIHYTLGPPPAAEGTARVAPKPEGAELPPPPLGEEKKKRRGLFK